MEYCEKGSLVDHMKWNLLNLKEEKVLNRKKLIKISEIVIFELMLLNSCPVCQGGEYSNKVNIN